MSGPLAALLADGKRLHLQHGPIDLIVQAFGERREIATAYAQIAERFSTVLEELVAELPRLRSACPPQGLGLRGCVARRMERAVQPYAETFVTPMAAVAGAVADECLAAMIGGRSLDRAYVNNGGDIALFLGPGAGFEVGMVKDPAAPWPDARATVTYHDDIRGIATSGRHGRSLSMGIADAVTVLAATAAEADVAATLIANAVDLPGNRKIDRVRADSLDPDSDLGGRLVTAGMGDLSPGEVARALARGAGAARRYAKGGRIKAAMLRLGDETRIVGELPAAWLPGPPAVTAPVEREHVHA